ncbi:hypothetical protein OBBRIDRAFT_300543 [Obba rivulosa]|uniref:Uncharacterized protein n=1 Tax=Obba rivulosa TaxID=1052685 RepID=A0A8E2ALF5_9APHY|nr:hypothetical protein OBBRIDRAFT_300543 [Obba rivulosa]
MQMLVKAKLPEMAMRLCQASYEAVESLCRLVLEVQIGLSMMNELRARLMRSSVSFGTLYEGCSQCSPRNSFPWAELTPTMISSGLVLVNYPEDVTGAFKNGIIAQGFACYPEMSRFPSWKRCVIPHTVYILSKGTLSACFMKTILSSVACLLSVIHHGPAAVVHPDRQGAMRLPRS